MIKAKAWSDCRGIEVEFDATKWAQQATNQAITDLIEIGCRGDYPADDVVLYMARFDKSAEKLFTFIELVPLQPFSGETNGFECEVDQDDLKKWLKENRPELYYSSFCGKFVCSTPRSLPEFVLAETPEEAAEKFVEENFDFDPNDSKDTVDVIVEHVDEDGPKTERSIPVFIKWTWSVRAQK